MGDQSNGDKLNLDPEKAYYLQRIDVLNECRAELLSSLKKRAWIVFAVAAIVGYLGLDTLLRQRLSEAGTLALMQQSLRQDEEFVKKVAANIPPVAVFKVLTKIEVPVGKAGIASLTCPSGTLPVGGGFKNPKSAVKLVQIYAEQSNLILQLDNTGSETFVVDAWAVCLKATEKQIGAAS